MARMQKLPGDIWQFDLEECGVLGRTGGYLVKGDTGWLLVETGPASSFPAVMEAVDALEIAGEDLLYIGVTHIHLDHAGGIGQVAQKFPKAKVLVHHKGARHVIEPTRLIEGATAVWGEEKMQKFGPILAVPEEQVIPVKEGDRIHLGNRVITVWDTPGHTKHHVCFFDSKTSGLFSGDAAGVYQPLLSKKLGRYVVRTATPPPDFNEEKMLQTLKRIALTELEVIYFTHFGALEKPLQLVQQLIGQLTLQMELARQYCGLPGQRLLLAEALTKQIRRELGIADVWNLGVSREDIITNEWHFMTGLMEMSAAGCLQYLCTLVSDEMRELKEESDLE